MKTDDRLATAFYDRAAGTYDRLMATPDSRRMRRRFLRTVARYLTGPGRILDYGCGTGIDARFYACTGHTVVAYDPSVAMLAPLRRRCSRAIRDGRVTPVTGGLDDCLAAAAAHGPFRCITSNFAVLNHIVEPDALLAALVDHLAPDGLVVASLLNPWYWRDVRQQWWWRSQWRSRGWKGLIVQEGENRTVRHDTSRIGTDAGLRQREHRGALHGGRYDRLPGLCADPLVLVVLERR